MNMEEMEPMEGLKKEPMEAVKEEDKMEEPMEAVKEDKMEAVKEEARRKAKTISQNSYQVLLNQQTKKVTAKVDFLSHIPHLHLLTKGHVEWLLKHGKSRRRLSLQGQKS